MLGERKSDRSKRTRTDATPSEGSMVSVTVCLDSGERAIRRSCRRTETRSFTREEARGLGPCPIHSDSHEAGMARAAEPPPEPPNEEAAPAEEVKPPEPPEEWVPVEICVETGLRSNTYCRLKRTVKIRKGIELGVCRLHGP